MAAKRPSELIGENFYIINSFVSHVKGVKVKITTNKYQRKPRISRVFLMCPVGEGKGDEVVTGPIDLILCVSAKL